MNLRLNELLEIEQTLRDAWMSLSGDIGSTEEFTYHQALHYVRNLRLYIDSALTSDLDSSN